MARLIMWNLMSLDGYFNGVEDWQLDFHNYVWGEELERFCLDQLDEVGGLIFGRITFEGMANYWTSDTTEIGSLMRKVTKYVFSRSLKNLDDYKWDNSILAKGNLIEEIMELKHNSDKDIFIFGSSKLSQELVSSNLIDEYRICIAPVLLGKGQPLFKQLNAELRLKLIESKSTKTGAQLLFYQPLN